jgi:leucyl-tRNA synthetase
MEPAEIDRWVETWRDQRTYEADAGSGLARAYVVSMYPYPSGDLHMGHAEAYSIGDCIARYQRMSGLNVLHPVGWDSFGLPAENAALRNDLDPREWTYANIEIQAESFRRLGISFDWRARLHTSDPEYYRWNQWLFLRLFERGLAYRAAAAVNWCPTDQTVLANEQVIAGRCERCGTAVVSRELTQWFFRITAYAQRLLDDMAQLEGLWPDDVLAMQRNWIGRCVDGEGAVTYRLHDWLISRQRYWGTPIPIVHCDSCGTVPIGDDELPVRLPETGYELRPGDGCSPLASAAAWVRVTCPRCGRPANRDTDTMDTFVDSSWYFLRYPNPNYADGPFDPDGVVRWLPVGEYIGGKEHATGHLIYARFMTKVLHDLGLVSFVEPFRRVINQGQVVMNGRSMSKSLGNLVSLQEQIARYGPDAVRVTMIFAGPPEVDIDWADVSPIGAVRWLSRVGRLTGDVAPAPVDGEDHALRCSVHRLIGEITAAMQARRLNVAVARLMRLTTVLRKAIDTGPGPADGAVREGVEALVRMLSCFAPFTSEEAWRRLGHDPSVTRTAWPHVAPALLVPRTVTCVVQVDGRVRDRLDVAPDATEDELRAAALASEPVTTAMGGRGVARVVVRAPRLVNVVTCGPRA